MKVICDGLDLSDAVLKVSKALSVKAVNPILEGIKLVADGDSLTLIATDLELTLEIKIKADVLMEGETVVVGKYFVDFIKKLENEQVELSRLFDGQLKIKYSSSESELQVFNSQDYPKFSNDETENQITMLQKDFKNIVNKITLACSSDDSRPILKGCLFEVIDGNLTMVALDGFRMAVVKKQVDANANFYSIIPARTLIEITRLLNDEDDKKELKLYFQKNMLFAEINNIKIYSRLIEGEFVKYSHILPTSFTNVVTVNKKLFLQSIERAAIIAKNDRYNIIKLDVHENVMNISAKSEIGNVNENVNINLNGKDITTAFNGKYLQDYLKSIDSDFINLNLNSQIDPCVFTEIGKEDYIYLVLPVRINA
jgi:DNA polymerase-3 subunit beta